MPEIIHINENSTLPIKRKGSYITWNKDPNNQSGVLFWYILQDEEEWIEDESYYIADDGVFSLDVLLQYTDIKYISLYVSRKNALNFPIGENNGKMEFYSSDFIIFKVED
ncbi:MAG: hypothetical protein LRY27_00445 [Chitinophagales bacterium]|nr:hypothetical protein [Chitinophagales bacterium]